MNYQHKRVVLTNDRGLAKYFHAESLNKFQSVAKLQHAAIQLLEG